MVGSWSRRCALQSLDRRLICRQGFIHTDVRLRKGSANLAVDMQVALTSSCAGSSTASSSSSSGAVDRFGASIVTSLKNSPGFMRVRHALERHGDWIVTCANVLQLCGFACYDSLWLQSLMVLGNGSMAFYFITRMPSLGVACGWAMLKVLVNVFMVYTIIQHRQPIKLTPEELEAYQEHFMHYGVSARQFKRFWDLGESRPFYKDDTLTVEGKPIPAVCLVLCGYVFRTRGGKHMEYLDSYPDARRQHGGDAGAWVGEICMLKMIDDSRVDRLSTVKIDAPDSTDERISNADAERKKEDAERIKEMQQMLVRFGFYDGVIDGHAGQRTAYGLRKFNEAFGTQPDAVDVQQMMLLQQQIVTNFWQMDAATWTTHVGRDGTVVRHWNLTEVLQLCDSSDEMRGALRKAFSQGAIKKAVALHQVEEYSDAADTGHAGQDVICRYESALRAALRAGRALPEDKAALSQFRRKNHISDRQHRSALRSAVGWTPEEYEHGAVFANIRSIRKSTAALVLRAEGSTHSWSDAAEG